MMPEGILQALTQQQVLDLLNYLADPLEVVDAR